MNMKKNMFKGNLDHHDPEYTGIEGGYNGIDYNDYVFELALQQLEKENKK